MYLCRAYVPVYVYPQANNNRNGTEILSCTVPEADRSPVYEKATHFSLVWPDYPH